MGQGMADLDFERLTDVLATAIASGASRVSATTWEWDSAGACEAPVPVVRFARPLTPAEGWKLRNHGVLSQQVPFEYEKGRNHPLHLIQWTPCRKCGPCLKRRASVWVARAIAEVQASSRTWFCTYTLSASSAFEIECECRETDHVNGSIFEHRSEHERFCLRAKLVGVAFTKYLKRLRKEGANLRYLLVAEAHKSGVPHLHALVHEVDPSAPVRKRSLQGQWTLGFSQVKLVPTEEASNAARYACKYLFKSVTTRIRGSVNYGNSDLYSKAATASCQREEMTPIPPKRIAPLGSSSVEPLNHTDAVEVSANVSGKEVVTAND